MKWTVQKNVPEGQHLYQHTEFSIFVEYHDIEAEENSVKTAQYQAPLFPSKRAMEK